MAINFTYMGTKRQIARNVAEIISLAPPGPLLDVFAGMAAVGTAVAGARNVWCNDTQHFANYVAQSYFTSKNKPRVSSNAIQGINSYLQINKNNLLKVFEKDAEREKKLYEEASAEKIGEFSINLIATSKSPRNLKRISAHREEVNKFPYSLFSTMYRGGYIGLEQAIDLDSLRYGIDRVFELNLINRETYRWMLIATCQALAKASNSTGHFAQYLTIKEATKDRFLTKRKRSILREWQSSLDNMLPLGTREWRAKNSVFREEATILLKKLRRHRRQPSVIYCDPPYTADHYSRYYHIMDTNLLYDYPKIESKGQYRTDRFYSAFSTKTKVKAAFEELIYRASALKACLVLSYPDNGLLSDSSKELTKMLKEKYRKVEIAAEIPHEHSSLGASKGIESAIVTERIFLASV